LKNKYTNQRDEKIPLNYLCFADHQIEIIIIILFNISIYHRKLNTIKKKKKSFIKQKLTDKKKEDLYDPGIYF